MTKITLPVSLKTVPMREMRAGQHGIIRDARYTNTYVFCAEEAGGACEGGIVWGWHPNGEPAWWTKTKENNLEVEILPPGKVIQLIA